MSEQKVLTLKEKFDQVYTACQSDTNCRHIIKPLQKHAYSNILKISPPKTERFQIKNSDIFHISTQNID